MLERGTELRERGNSRRRKRGKEEEEEGEEEGDSSQLSFVLGQVQGTGAAPLGSSFPFPTGSSFPGRWQLRGLTSTTYPAP